MFRMFIVALLVAIGMALPAKAEETASFAQLLEKLRQHPEVASYSAKAESSQHYAKGELGLPDPMLTVQEQDYPIGSSMSRNFEEKMIGFKQEIPAFGVRSSKSEKNQVDARKQGLAADYAFASMKAKLIATLANLQAIRAQEKLLDQQSALFGSERASIKGRIAANQSGVSRLSMSQAESTELDIMRAELGEEKHDMMAMLTNMVGETPDVAPPIIQPTEWSGDADKTYPVRLASQDIDMARKDVDTREAEFNPHFEVAANYGRMYGGDNAGTIMVGLSIPLWASESQKPRLEGAKAALHSSELDRDTVRRNIIEKLDHLKAQIDTSAEKIKLIENKNTQLGAAASATTREYEAGKADLPMVLKAKREAISARYQLAAEQARHTTLVADFNHYIIQGE